MQLALIHDQSQLQRVTSVFPLTQNLKVAVPDSISADLGE